MALWKSLLTQCFRGGGGRQIETQTGLACMGRAATSLQHNTEAFIVLIGFWAVLGVCRTIRIVGLYFGGDISSMHGGH